MARLSSPSPTLVAPTPDRKSIWQRQGKQDGRDGKSIVPAEVQSARKKMRRSQLNSPSKDGEDPQRNMHCRGLAGQRGSHFGVAAAAAFWAARLAACCCFLVKASLPSIPAAFSEDLPIARATWKTIKPVSLILENPPNLSQ